MTDLANTHSTSSNLIRQTGAAHGADAFKVKSLPEVSHSTSVQFHPLGFLDHGTDTTKHLKPSVQHKTDAYKLRSTTSASAPSSAVLAANSFAEATASQSAPNLSKNSNAFVGIGSGLSVMVGLPRIATWNSSGRPINPKVGTVGFNIETNCLEFWDGKNWFFAPMEDST